MAQKHSIISYVFYFLIFFLASHLFKDYHQKYLEDDEMKQYKLIEKYLLNDSSLANSDKPILWIFTDYNKNTRNWSDFGSRTSNNLNQPYKVVCIKSIIRKCGEDFNVCLIDSNSFSKLIPGWSIDLNKVSTPMKEKIQKLALFKLLYHYGGILVPNSFLCTNNLINLYNKFSDSCFVFETTYNNTSTNYGDFYPNSDFIGCKKNCEIMKDLYQFVETDISRDYTDESSFKKSIDSLCFKHVKDYKMEMISGLSIGVKTKEKNMITVDNLLGNEYINFYDNLYGIYIPSKELERRTKHNWFLRMSEQQLLESDMILTKHMLINH